MKSALLRPAMIVAPLVLGVLIPQANRTLSRVVVPSGAADRVADMDLDWRNRQNIGAESRRAKRFLTRFTRRNLNFFEVKTGRRAGGPKRRSPVVFLLPVFFSLPTSG